VLNWLYWIIIGGVVGGIASLIVPGRTPGGMIGAIVVGLIGGGLGGWLLNDLLGLGLGASLVGAVVVGVGSWDRTGRRLTSGARSVAFGARYAFCSVHASTASGSWTTC
jgi:uncharacterized membrane protein YeaQ/YmgE (transglycosylase-associated protein family)